MKAIDRPLQKIINGITQFVIPVFQRDYSWTEAECDQLWKDVTEIARDTSERGHFLGSVVYISTGDTSAGFTRWLLIDGQQRVTTLRTRANTLLNISCPKIKKLPQIGVRCSVKTGVSYSVSGFIASEI